MASGPPTRVLHVDLSTGTATSESLAPSVRRRFLGGKGVGAYTLYRELAPGTDPLSPDNVLVLAVGPLTGLLPGEPRCVAVTKSPLSGTFTDSYVGGAFAARLPNALGDHAAVVVEGEATEPTVLRLADGAATLRPTDQWGRSIPETDRALDGATACIGPAGERRVRYATLGTDGGDHQAGRGGVGAVAGSKRLKAVVADGEPRTPTDVGDEAASVADAYDRAFHESDTGRWLDASGTMETLDFADEVGVLPTRGWQADRFEGSERIGIDAVRAAATARERDGDFRIATAPSEDTASDDRNSTVPRGATPMVLGAGLGIDDFDAVVALGDRCDRLGMDVISAGNAVAWAIRASDTGLLDDVETPPLAFGDPAAAEALLTRIAARDGALADALADGVDAAAARFGGDDLVPTVKSVALPAYDPRGSLAMALAYATSDRGACHRRARPVVTEVFATERWSHRERAEAVAAEQTLRSALWCLVADDFVGETLSDYGAELLATVGLAYEPDELLDVGERVWTLTRLFNVREGFTRDEDRLPTLVRQPSADAVREGVDPATFDDLLSTYYRVREWDAEGRPTRALLDRLDLLDLVDDATPVPGGTAGDGRNDGPERDA
ncbi:aldehyde ferredoxin oxidoreductase family protein [Salinigranum sp.]|uniref:aldehyde ferredoxin oxidoreductase family protein n=1 Tax=Salinigranum sp. TaxID=1966351 RepID=UPI003561C70E